MTMITKQLLTPITLILLLLLSVSVSYAQSQNPLTVTVDRASLSTDEFLTLTVTLDAAVSNPPNPTVPALEGFNIVGSSSSSQISIINGAMTSQQSYSYRLQPYQAGALVIEPVTVTMGGQTFSTEPITVQVSQGTGQPQAASPRVVQGEPAPAPTELTGQDFFVEAEVDTPSPYLGQAVLYTFRFYQAANLFGQPNYEAPAFTGFWGEPQPEQSQYQVQVAGRTYKVTELKTTLFPTLVGDVTIEPAHLTIPGGFFQRDTALQTQPVEIAVKPLPANAPDGFNGAVGQGFEITAEADTTTGKVNEPITLNITLTGQGNLNNLPDPVWPEMAEWRVFESQAMINTAAQAGAVQGSRVYERLLVPETAGEFTIPAIDYTYFDPTEGKYHTIATAPIPVSIEPGSGPAPASFSANNETPTTTIPPVNEVRHIKPAPALLNLSRQPLTSQPWYWLAWGIPLAALVGNGVWQRREQYWQRNGAVIRSSQARNKAKKTLAQAQKQPDLYAAAHQVLSVYLSDKLNQPVVGLTRQALANLLTEREVTSNLLERLEDCLDRSELGRFALEANTPAHATALLNEVDGLVDELDKVL